MRLSQFIRRAGIPSNKRAKAEKFLDAVDKAGKLLLPFERDPVLKRYMGSLMDEMATIRSVLEHDLYDERAAKGRES